VAPIPSAVARMAATVCLGKSWFESVPGSQFETVVAPGSRGKHRKVIGQPLPDHADRIGSKARSGVTITSPLELLSGKSVRFRQ